MYVMVLILSLFSAGDTGYEAFDAWLVETYPDISPGSREELQRRAEIALSSTYERPLSEDELRTLLSHLPNFTATGMRAPEVPADFPAFEETLRAAIMGYVARPPLTQAEQEQAAAQMEVVFEAAAETFWSTVDPNTPRDEIEQMQQHFDILTEQLRVDAQNPLLPHFKTVLSEEEFSEMINSVREQPMLWQQAGERRRERGFTAPFETPFTMEDVLSGIRFDFPVTEAMNLAHQEAVRQSIARLERKMEKEREERRKELALQRKAAADEWAAVVAAEASHSQPPQQSEVEALPEGDPGAVEIAAPEEAAVPLATGAGKQDRSPLKYYVAGGVLVLGLLSVPLLKRIVPRFH